MEIIGIDTDRFYSLNEAKSALEGAQGPLPGDRDHNIYWYEMWPLIRIIEHLNKTGGNSVRLKFSDGERNDDGIIAFNGKEQEIQFVLAIDGQQERIRDEHLERYGRAPGVQNMQWSGKKRERVLPEQNTEAFERTEIMENLKSLIQDAVQRKIKPQYYGMWLGVVFEDHTPPASEKTTQNYTAVCDCVMKTYRDQLEKFYKKIFFVGTSGSYIKQFNV